MAAIGRLVKKTDIEYPFEHAEAINYILDGVSMHTVTTKIQASFLTAQGFHNEANGDFKQLELNGCDRRKTL